MKTFSEGLGCVSVLMFSTDDLGLGRDTLEGTILNFSMKVIVYVKTFVMNFNTFVICAFLYEWPPYSKQNFVNYSGDRYILEMLGFLFAGLFNAVVFWTRSDWDSDSIEASKSAGETDLGNWGSWMFSLLIRISTCCFRTKISLLCLAMIQ